LQREFQNITDTEQKLKITLTREEVEPSIKSAFAEISKKVQLPGFRPGKVPQHLVKKMYGESIEADEHAKLAQKYMEEVFKEENIFVVSQPHLHDIIKVDGGIEFTLHYDYIPAFDLQDYKSLVVDEPSHKVTDEEIDEYLELVSYKKSALEVSDVIENKNYRVTVEDLKLTEDESLPKEFPVSLRSKQLIPELTEMFIGKKVDDEIHFEKELSEDEIAQGLTSRKIDLKIKKIEKMIPQEFNEAFIKKLSNNKFSTIEEYREEVGLNIQESWDAKSSDIMGNNIIDKILSLHDIKIPNFLIEEQAAKMFEDFLKENKISSMKFEDSPLKNLYIEQAEKIIKWDLIREKIIKAEDITVEDHDINDYVESAFKNATVDPSIIIEYVKNNKQVINSILVKKVMNFLIDFTTSNEVEFAESRLDFNDEFEGEFDEDEDEDIFDADEEFIDESEFDGEFFEDDEEFDDFEEEDEYDDEDENDDEEEFDDDEASKK
jgi:trigger factor